MVVAADKKVPAGRPGLKLSGGGLVQLLPDQKGRDVFQSSLSTMSILLERDYENANVLCTAEKLTSLQTTLIVIYRLILSRSRMPKLCASCSSAAKQRICLMMPSGSVLAK